VVVRSAGFWEMEGWRRVSQAGKEKWKPGEGGGCCWGCLG